MTELKENTPAADRINEKTRKTLSMYLDNGETGREWASSLKTLAEDAALEYEGRFLVELIQNGYDAHAPGSTGGRIEILLDLAEAEHGVLYVANTGRAFTYQNFAAITAIAQSSKPPGEGIGNKGIGFKSVLQISDWPEVYSTPINYTPSSDFDGYSFRFARRSDIAKLVSKEHLDDAVRDLSALALPIPVEKVPDRALQLRSGGFCTVIRLPLRDPKAAKRAESEMQHLASSTTPILLFLDRISSLTMHAEQVDGSLTAETELQRNAKPFVTNGSRDAPDLTEVNLGDQGSFLVATRSVAAEKLKAAIAESSSDIASKWSTWSDDSTVSVAVQLDSVNSAWHFYTFLPMNSAPAPLAAHVNAPFFTKIDRNKVSFEVYFNDFLLTEVALLCVDTALWIRNNAAQFGALCVDLICWSEDFFEWLKFAFDEREIELETAELIPVLPKGDRRFGPIDAVRTWEPSPSALTRLTPESVTAATDSMIVEPRIGENRIARFRVLRRSLNHWDDGSPRDYELADWVECVARAMSKRQAGPDTTEWMDFYDDVAAIFDGRQDAPLHGRKIVIDNRRRLRPFVSKEAGQGGTAFFYPVRERTAGEEDIDASLDVDPPRELQKGLWFTHRDLSWLDEEGSHRPAREFFERARLVRRYRTQDVLEAVGRVVAGNRTDDSVLRAALLFVFKLRDRVNSAKSLKSIRLSVPTAGGWCPAEEALFSKPWTQTQGATIEKLINLTASESPDIAEMGQRLVKDPADWLPEGSQADEWADFLRCIGVRDGLHPIAKAKLKTLGSNFTPAAWARTADIQDSGIVDEWQERTPRPHGYQEHPRSVYVSSDLWCLPGQFEFSGFLPAAQQLYAQLIIGSLGSWPTECFGASVRRENYPDIWEPDWPTPLGMFLDSHPWVPVKTRDSSLALVAPEKAWLFDDDAEQDGQPPMFVPIIPRGYRSTLRRNPEAWDRLQQWCGIHCWNDPAEAPAVMRFVSTQLADGQSAADQWPELVREYENALHRSLDRSENPWLLEDVTPKVVVRCRDLVEVVSLESGCGPLYVEADGDPAHVRLIRDLGAKILCARAADGKRAFELLKVVVGSEVRLLSDVDVIVEADGAPVTVETVGLPLIQSGTEWLVSVVVAAMEFRSGPFRPYSATRLRDAARLLRSTHLIPAGEICLNVDGHRSVESGRTRGVVAMRDLARPFIVVKDFPGNIGADTLARLTDAIAAVAGAPDLGSVIFEAVARLDRNANGLSCPTAEECADALGITDRQFNDACALLRSPTGVLRERIPIIVACQLSLRAGQDIQELLEDTHSPDDVLAAMSQFSLQSPSALVDLALRVDDLVEIRSELQVDYKEFNRILVALGRTSLANPDAHDQAFAYYVKVNRDPILARLRGYFLDDFNEGRDLSEYLALRKLDIHRDPDWPNESELPTAAMMAGRTHDWLSAAGASTLDEVNDQDDVSIDGLRFKNRKVIINAGDAAGSLVRAWAVKQGKQCPELWSGDGAGGRLADWADAQGLLDFVVLTDLQPLLAHLIRARLWPDEMPRALDAESLSLTPEDITDGQSAQDRQRAEQQRARTTIMIGPEQLSTDPDGFVDVVSAIRANMRADLTRTPFRTAELSAAPPGKTAGSSAVGKEGSFYRGSVRFNEGQRAVVGLAAEVIAFDWLSAQSQYKDAQIHWRSGYRDKVLGGSEGNDRLGYDIEVITAANTYIFEVKGAAAERTEFELTALEIDAARRNTLRDKYRIIFVRHVCEPSSTSVLLLPNPFTKRGSEVFYSEGSGLRYRFDPR